MRKKLWLWIFIWNNISQDQRSSISQQPQPQHYTNNTSSTTPSFNLYPFVQIWYLHQLHTEQLSQILTRQRIEHRLFSLTEPDALRACALHSPGFFLLNHSVLCSLVSTMNYSIMLALIPSCCKQNKTKQNFLLQLYPREGGEHRDRQCSLTQPDTGSPQLARVPQYNTCLHWP